MQSGKKEWITAIPDFPNLTVTPRPGGWFTREEIIKLFEFTQPWVWQADISGVERRKRAYAHYYMQWLVFTGVRGDEALQARYEDVTILRAKPPKQTRDCLFVKVKGGKLSYLKGTTEMVGLVGAVGAFEELKKSQNSLSPLNPRISYFQSIRVRLFMKSSKLQGYCSMIVANGAQPRVSVIRTL